MEMTMNDGVPNLQTKRSGLNGWSECEDHPLSHEEVTTGTLTLGIKTIWHRRERTRSLHTLGRREQLDRASAH